MDRNVVLSEDDFINKLKNVKCVVSDVDGTLTEGGLYYGESGDVFHRFNVRDGRGMLMLKESGILVAVVTGSNNFALKKRFQVLKVTELHMGIADKSVVIKEIKSKHGFGDDEVLHIGDDINDITAFKEVNLRVAVNDGMPDLVKFANYRTKANGGCGAFREISDMILKAQNKYVLREDRDIIIV